MKFLQKIALLIGGMSLAGCAFSPGNPWGILNPHLEASFAPAEGRLTETGALKTSNDYAIALSRLEVTFGDLSVTLTSGGDPTTFDPADPPEGYLLCHSGHCHADDGSLVPYEEVEAELAAGSGASSFQVTIDVDSAVALDEVPVDIPLGTCSGDCDLEAGELSAVSLTVGELAFEGVVYDVGQGNRIAADGVAIQGELPLEVVTTGYAEGTVGKGEPLVVQLDAGFLLPDQLFDGVDWQAAVSGAADPLSLIVEDGSDAATEIEDNLGEYAELALNVTRSDE